MINLFSAVLEKTLYPSVILFSALVYCRPIIVKIKTECQQQFRDYERCMNSNPVHPEYCLEDYMAFNSCAEQHVGQKSESGISSLLVLSQYLFIELYV